MVLVLAALVAVGFTWLGPEGARATFPGDNGRIAFERGGLIWVMNPDGSHQTRLTCQADFDADKDGWPAGSPAWSPEGQRIAFERDDGWRTTLIYVMPSDGIGQRDVSVGFDPVWSPDGQRIAYHTLTAGPFLPLQVGVVTAGGEHVTPEFPGERFDSGNSSPAWSPDGQRLAFVHPGPAESPSQRGPDIWAMNVDGSGQINLTDNAAVNEGPAWSPDGQRIAFWRPDGVWIMNADGGNQSPVAEGGRWPAWSPDGRRIAFVRDIRRSEPDTWVADIWVMRPDGSGQARLAGGATAPRRTDSAILGSHVWSPDSQRIAFVRGGDVWVMKADGSGQTNLTRSPREDSAPDWQSRPSPPDADPPPRQFCFGPVRQNRDRGTARLVVHVPQPGRVILHRRPGVRGFAQARDAAGPGRVVLRVRPRGRARHRLDRGTNRLPVRAQVTFRPGVGEPLTKGRRVWLVQR